MINKDLEAQVKLLEDPDLQIYRMVKPTIVNQGSEIIPYLETVWGNSLLPIVHSRIEDIIHTINFTQVLLHAEKWVDTGRKDWLSILLTISKVYFQAIDESLLKSQFEQIKREIWLELNDNLTAFEKIQIVNYIIYKKHKIKRINQTKPDGKPFFVSEVLTHKKGNDYSLGLFYKVLCQSLDLPVYGIDLPGNFILAYLNTNHVNWANQNAEDVLFYINPFNNGAVFGHQEIEQYIEKNKLKVTENQLNPTSNIMILKSYFSLIQENLKSNNEFEKADELEQLMKIILL
ncbi:MAG: transglutaminase family protein [Bacteroidales bacterium]|nr:transglutaminase family protein [Bacteroidales bacterium]